MKKKIPIALRKILDKEIQGNKDIIDHEFENGIIIRFTDSDRESDYYFEIQSTNISGPNHATTYTIKYKPYSDVTNAPRSINVNLSSLQECLRKWISLINESNSESPLFDDFFTQTYYEELEPEFQILDDDASFRPYKSKQQKRIIEFLDKVEEIIRDEKPNQNEKEVKETIQLIELTKSTISKSTKKEVVKNLRKIIAKGFKMGLQIGERLLIEFSAELTKKIFLEQ